MFYVVKLLRLPDKMLKYSEFDLTESSDSIQQQCTSFGPTQLRVNSNCELFVWEVVISAALCMVQAYDFSKWLHSSTPVTQTQNLFLL